MINKNEDKGSFIEYIINISNYILNICKKTEEINGNLPEVMASITYIVGHLLMSLVHEPWYDEAVAWQIAKCASLSEILFEIPHYEGHPPLWHLVLIPFAKTGAPYELSLSIVSLLFAGTAIIFIIWKSPFPRIIRLLLPFTYFYFYQYSVISRPYCVMMFAFVLISITYSKRDYKPKEYVISLMILCLTSAYGIVLSGGMAIAWLWDILAFRNIFKEFKELVKDKRVIWLFVLLIFAVLLISEILPKEDTFVSNIVTRSEGNNNIIIRLLYMILALPADLIITSIYNQYTFLQCVEFNYYFLSLSCICGLFLIYMLISNIPKNVGKHNFIVPYIFFSLFCVYIYMCAHHIGIELLLIISFSWIIVDNHKSNKKFSFRSSTLLNGCMVLLVSLGMICSLTWNFSSCVQDVLVSYAAGREEADFIKEYELDNLNIMAEWEINYDEHGNIENQDITRCIYTDNIAPYFEKNIFFNFNLGKDELNYAIHKHLSGLSEDYQVSEWKKVIPDVLFMKPRLDLVYDESVISFKDYTLVYVNTHHHIWKGTTGYSKTEIYVRNDLLDKLGLKEFESVY